MIGIFGDSYADPNSQSKDRPWMSFLSDKMNLPVNNYGRSGTSIWYSYEKFIENYKKYTHIVFSYSSYERINHLPEKYTGCHYYKPSAQNKDKINDIATVYFKYLYNENLQLFLYQKLYEEINRLCNEAGINLINNLAYEPERFENRYYMKLIDAKNVVGASIIDQTEISRFKPGAKNVTDIGLTIDSRVCHFSQANNIILANIMFDLFNSEIKTVHLDRKDFSFHLRDLRKYFENKT